MKPEKKLQIRNSATEFLIFTRQAGEDGIEVRVAEETVWLTQKLMAALFAVDVRTVNNIWGTSLPKANSGGTQLSGNFGWFNWKVRAKSNARSNTTISMPSLPSASG